MLQELDGMLGVGLAAIFGLMIGSFLNVVIYRLPRMMELQWEREAAAITNHSMATPNLATDTFNLVTPRSRCGKCGHAVAWYENIPVVSYIFLRGRCSACGVHISLRYPAVELLGAALAAYCAHRWGLSLAGVAWFGFCAVLLTLALIDLDTTLLPDDLTLPLLWGGLIASALHWTVVPLADAIWGAVGGYLSLWSVYWAFKLLTGKEGMGYGDFKLLAALGAWFGWQALVPVVLASSLIGAVVGIGMKLTKHLQEGQPIPFGPFLAGAGFVALFFGPQSLLKAIGL
ncbi:MAG: prepilin peptidase [Betaproteobacteria bacterium]|nr:prepilin peptidase [Betaproteobacteria bacterium]